VVSVTKLKNRSWKVPSPWSLKNALACTAPRNRSPIRRVGSFYADAVDDIDDTGAQTILELAGQLQQRGIVFAVAEASEAFRAATGAAG